MKLLLLMCIDEHKKNMHKILADHKVSVFSQVAVEGFRTREKQGLDAAWFRTTEMGVYSELMYTIVSHQQADELMEAIQTYNEENVNNHPLRAFKLNVEQAL